MRLASFWPLLLATSILACTVPTTQYPEATPLELVAMQTLYRQDSCWSLRQRDSVTRKPMHEYDYMVELTLRNASSRPIFFDVDSVGCGAVKMRSEVQTELEIYEGDTAVNDGIACWFSAPDSLIVSLGAIGKVLTHIPLTYDYPRIRIEKHFELYTIVDSDSVTMTRVQLVMPDSILIFGRNPFESAMEHHSKSDAN